MSAPADTVTFLFSDIEGSTARWEAHREAMQEAVARHDELMRSVIERHGGCVFKTVGDEFCTAFANAKDALAAAIEAQYALRERDWSSIEGLRVRMAIHAGAVEHRDNDYFGPPVNRVARLLSVAHGEQIVLSETVASSIGDSLAEGFTLRDLGSHRLK
ncbi:MAG: adenylate/guanylate cyclase domain-containing protein, partial [Candidatus Eremiobacteraeota bacterium]|nr:adenylate/guanylate cyclase domain-containing protein [Candidatus Eremiobacteraeota bacterium]